MEPETAWHRFVVPNVLTSAECHELIFLQRAFGVPGDRPNFSTCTLREFLAPRARPLCLAFLRAREKLRDVVEAAIGEELGLHFEFSGLTCWQKGSSIPPHYDANREYLRQRHISVVCYLNYAGVDFSGGELVFHDHECAAGLREVRAATGAAVVFSSDARNIHSVREVRMLVSCGMHFAAWMLHARVYFIHIMRHTPALRHYVTCSNIQKLQLRCVSDAMACNRRCARTAMCRRLRMARGTHSCCG